MGSREKAFLTLVDGEEIVGTRKKARADRKPKQSVVTSSWKRKSFAVNFEDLLKKPSKTTNSTKKKLSNKGPISIKTVWTLEFMKLSTITKWKLQIEEDYYEQR